MARTGPPQPAPRLEHPGVRMVAVVASFHRELGERLLTGARDRLAEAGLPEARLEVRRVPGAYEIPLAAQTLARTGRYAAVIGLGVVVRGQTAHFDFICAAAADGLQRVALATGVPCAFGILTTETVEQAEARSGGSVGNAGADAADAAVVMANLVAGER